MRRPIEYIIQEIDDMLAMKRLSHKKLTNVKYPHHNEDRLRTIALRHHELMHQAETMKKEK